MTSLAFIFGVSPMVWAVGAGAELRQTLGTTVFSGMIGVTIFGLIFTPVFYVVSRGSRSEPIAARGACRPAGGVSAAAYLMRADALQLALFAATSASRRLAKVAASA
jgi:hypothetical protein